MFCEQQISILEWFRDTGLKKIQIFKFSIFKIENSYVFILIFYYITYHCIFDAINADLVSIRTLFHKTVQYINI